MLNLVFGVTVFAISTVLVSFMLGLAFGGILFGRIAEKAKSIVGLFAFVHWGIFLSTIILFFAFPGFQELYCAINKSFNPDFVTFRIILFFLSLLLLVIPTTLMGATFPVAAKIIVDKNKTIGKDVGVLYSVNTLGSVVGCIATIFFLLGFAGMKGTVVFAAFFDLVIGVTAMLMSKTSKSIAPTNDSI